MKSFLIRIVVAFALTIASGLVGPSTDEHAMYGNMGPPEQNWQPREVAGWPAPYLADKPGTSVIHQLGVEDEFRPGPFVASLSLWYVMALILSNIFLRPQNTVSKFDCPGRMDDTSFDDDQTS
jgi:hypothetical protein